MSECFNEPEKLIELVHDALTDCRAMHLAKPFDQVAYLAAVERLNRLDLDAFLISDELAQRALEVARMTKKFFGDPKT